MNTDKQRQTKNSYLCLSVFIGG